MQWEFGHGLRYTEFKYFASTLSQPELRGRQGDGPALPHAVFRTISVPEVKQLKKFTEIGLTKVAEDADYMIAINPETDCDVYSDTAVANPLCANFTLQPGEHPFGSFE
ncbi:hypothetical protein PR002_g32624 [Phytophthora rubi]|uniref:Uncharacterized protein n=1 Tax=Phytophthora rubi TaxID=129364 RepID=A0A6A3G7A5_9STRA|nr:hypothetical protein PR002_g32624 [Phytophthora rubi]